MNALADARVASYCNEAFICTYLKVGTFQIINGEKVGGNVASYFCLDDGSVVHAIAGQVGADKLLEEARWAYETRKSALTFGTDLVTGEVDPKKFKAQVKQGHLERYHAEVNPGIKARNRFSNPLPAVLPRTRSQQVQTHWLLAQQPLESLETIYPVVWTQILREQLSALPVLKQ